jgi:hypothetical protein
MGDQYERGRDRMPHGKMRVRSKPPTMPYDETRDAPFVQSTSLRIPPRRFPSEAARRAAEAHEHRPKGLRALARRLTAKVILESRKDPDNATIEHGTARRFTYTLLLWMAIGLIAALVWGVYQAYEVLWR